MKKITILISLMFMILLTISGIAFPWEIDNHKKMSQKAVNISQLPAYFENNLGLPFSLKQFQGPAHSEGKWDIEEFAKDDNYTATEWIKHGSGAEDEFFKWWLHLPHYGKNMRSINHFYNPFWDNRDIYPYPYDDWGNYWLFQEGGLYDDIVTGIAGVDLYVGKPLTRWGYDGCQDSPPNSYFTRSDNNYFSWIMARKYLYAALSGNSTEIDGIGGIEGKTNMNENERDRCFALLFRSLGQLLHLVQDAGQSEHTRNDAHPLSGILGFEKYALYYNCTIPPCSSVIPWQSIIKSDNPFFDFIDSNRTGGGYYPVTSTGIAEFSNYNFLTKDSIADNIIGPEPHGHERHRYFTSPRINESQVVLQEGFLYDTYYYLSGPLIDPFGIYPGTEYKLAKRKWYHNLLVLYGWGDYTTEDPRIWDDYLDILIPKCIGYSAALLDYFFRGTLEITDPEEGVDCINVKVRNTTPDEVVGEGIIQAVARYKEGGEADFSYSVSSAIAIISLSSTDPTEFTFDFTNYPIPAGITDLYLHVIFKGTLGNETDNAIAVGMKDLNEQYVYVTISDYVTIWSLETGEVAEDVLDNNGVPVTFPCHKDDLEEWLEGVIDRPTRQVSGMGNNHKDIGNENRVELACDFDPSYGLYFGVKAPCAFTNTVQDVYIDTCAPYPYSYPCKRYPLIEKDTPHPDSIANCEPGDCDKSFSADAGYGTYHLTKNCYYHRDNSVQYYEPYQPRSKKLYLCPHPSPIYIRPGFPPKGIEYSLPINSPYLDPVIMKSSVASFDCGDGYNTWDWPFTLTIRKGNTASFSTVLGNLMVNYNPVRGLPSEYDGLYDILRQGLEFEEDCFATFLREGVCHSLYKHETRGSLWEPWMGCGSPEHAQEWLNWCWAEALSELDKVESESNRFGVSWCGSPYDYRNPPEGQTSGWYRVLLRFYMGGFHAGGHSCLQNWKDNPMYCPNQAGCDELPDEWVGIPVICEVTSWANELKERFSSVQATIELEKPEEYSKTINETKYERPENYNGDPDGPGFCIDKKYSTLCAFPGRNQGYCEEDNKCFPFDGTYVLHTLGEAVEELINNHYEDGSDDKLLVYLLKR